MTEEREQECIRMGICPKCSKKLAFREGCVECPHCGWSSCDEA